MADTQKTLAALITLFADNTSGDISPQDLRDFLVSVFGGYGSIYVNGGSTAQTGISGTPAKMTGFAVNGISSGTTPDHTSDNITIITAGDYLINASVSFVGSSSDVFQVEIYNNTTGTGYAFNRFISAGGDTGSASCNALITCAASDEISLYISSSTGGTSFTPQEASLIVTRVQ
jgi:hypothetical protein